MTTRATQVSATDAASLVGRRYEVEVGPVAHGGHCVARHEGRVLFVRHALPGERVVAQVTEGGEGSRYLRADAVEVLEPAKERVAPPCPYAGPGRCGGCDWQHAAPGAQRKLKAQVITEQLQRLAGLTPAEAGWDGSVEPAPGDKVPAGQVPGWRTRVQYAVDPATGRVGLRRHRSHEVQPVERCLIASPGVTELGVEARQWPQTATVEAIAASGSGDRQVVITPVPDGRLPLVELDRPVSVQRVDEHGGLHRVHGRSFVRERAAGRTWRVTGGGFWQIHPAAPDLLVDAVLDGLAPGPGENALDLYCGVGLFAGALSDRIGPAGAVLGIESSKQAVADARHNLADLIEDGRVRIECEKVERLLPRTGITSTDLVVLDPPRSGAGRDLVRHLAGLGPRRIAYVACDPAALARDLGFFAELGYRPVSLRAFDLFPMTQHVECVAVLAPEAVAEDTAEGREPAAAEPDERRPAGPPARSRQGGGQGGREKQAGRGGQGPWREERSRPDGGVRRGGSSRRDDMLRQGESTRGDEGPRRDGDARGGGQGGRRGRSATGSGRPAADGRSGTREGRGRRADRAGD